MKDQQIVKQHYNSDPQQEWQRLEQNYFEHEITCAYLDRYISPGESVLDIGGGPGRYSLYLAEKGCAVTHFDLAEENVRFALEKAQEQGVPLKSVCGDALVVDELVDGKFDHILIMGPLYHLTDEDCRTQAVERALRLLTPGGKLYASFISTIGGIVFAMRDDPLFFLDLPPHEEAWMSAVYERRGVGGDYFTRAYAADPGEIAPFFEQFPLKKLHILSQEGMTAPFRNVIIPHGKELMEKHVEISLRLCEHEELLSYAEHIMYIGEKYGA